MKISLIKKYDKKGMFNLIKCFPFHLESGLKKYERTIIPGNFGNINKIIINGMGGSAVAGDVIKSVFSEKSSIPVFVNRNYEIPKWVDKNTLAISISYSGNTKETVNSFELSIKAKAKTFCITSGGSLLSSALKYRSFVYLIPGGFPPRASLGHIISPLICALNSIKILNLVKDAKEAVILTKELSRKYSRLPNIPEKLAGRLKGNLVIISGITGFSDDTAFRWKTQLDENSKSLAYNITAPEMLHNEIAAWDKLNKQKSLFNNLAVIFLRDNRENSDLKKKMEISKSLFSQKTKHVFNIYPSGKSKLSRILSMIYFGDFLSYYLSMLNSVDPTPISAIDMLKKCAK